MNATVAKTYKFLQEAYSELTKVTWPSRSQAIRLTGFVIGVSLGVAIFVWGVDLIFKELLSFVIIR